MTTSIIMKFVILAGLILMFLGLTKFKKNIYIQTAFISMGTLAVGGPLLFFVYFGAGPVIGLISLVLVWPLQIPNLLLLLIFDKELFALENEYIGFFLAAVFQYLGYLGLLLGVRKVKVLYKKKKAAKLSP